jgi:hypothetical protein
MTWLVVATALVEPAKAVGAGATTGPSAGSHDTQRYLHN